MKNFNEFETLKDLARYIKDLEKHLKEGKKILDDYADEAVKLALQTETKKGIVEVDGTKFEIETKEKFKITKEEEAYPVLKVLFPGLVKESVNHMSLQKNMKELSGDEREAVLNSGVAVIEEIKAKLY